MTPDLHSRDTIQLHPPEPNAGNVHHVYNIRHIQHHAAQLALRLRIDFGEDIRWCGSGWRDG